MEYVLVTFVYFFMFCISKTKISLQMHYAQI